MLSLSQEKATHRKPLMCLWIDKCHSVAFYHAYSSQFIHGCSLVFHISFAIRSHYSRFNITVVLCEHRQIAVCSAFVFLCVFYLLPWLFLSVIFEWYCKDMNLYWLWQKGKKILFELYILSDSVASEQRKKNVVKIGLATFCGLAFRFYYSLSSRLFICLQRRQFKWKLYPLYSFIHDKYSLIIRS